ncbi:MAG: patatin-like phospholipase family protein [Thermodesulfobacteriota bacterium]|nr:patatin-like phospholipase family protein [Thermodesulfobacteriota bacterium]
MNYQFKNLIFEGGGVKGVAYAGAIKVLEEKGIMPNIVRVGGTSAGAINAVLVGLGYTSAQTLNIMNKLDFKKFMDDDLGVFRDIDRLLNEFGWHKGAFFRKWISKLIKNKTGNPDATFADVQKQKQEKGFRDMYFIGANISTHFAEVFSHEHTPRMCIADAVRISMSIPLFFASHRSPRGDVYVDGGLLDNYPVKLFDRKKYVAQEDLSGHVLETKYYKKHNQQLKRKGMDISPYIYNKETLGFRLDSEREIAVFRDQSEPAHAEITDFSSYSLNLIKTIMDSQANTHLHSDDWQRTIYVDTLGVKTTDFSLTDAKKKALVESGRNGTETYFKWFDSPASKAVNRA